MTYILGLCLTQKWRHTHTHMHVHTSPSSTADWTQGFLHANQMSYCWDAPPARGLGADWRGGTDLLSRGLGPGVLQRGWVHTAGPYYSRELGRFEKGCCCVSGVPLQMGLCTTDLSLLDTNKLTQRCMSGAFWTSWSFREVRQELLYSGTASIISCLFIVHFYLCK